ncbi:MAG: DNA/RNA non-specific endonuclease [Deltaproteobacteria bacterium]|nr:DNA/RNA non-specific endonuclease [Deltaproteobacteria bacterium]
MEVAELPSRKTFINPIVPGVSIGHERSTAGTVGCVVYDVHDGSPYILSNWHVLNGPGGKVGDTIVQPGPYDDNRLERNVAGKLIRSYLGIAGDCAIATVDRRRLSPEIMGIKKIVSRIGEPDLGDRVVKSGRTTDVTYGIVNRIHVTISLDYDLGEPKEIGCFEIGPDPENPAANSQISKGGDSGAVWLSVEKRKPTDMMLGLHFAGDAGDQSDYAMACYPASVFEKLEITPIAPDARKVRAEAVAAGFDEGFLVGTVMLPEPSNAKMRNDLVKVKGNTKINYTHFSLAMSRSRRFALWVAWNVDGSSMSKLSRSSLKFTKDSHVPEDVQVGDELYANNPLDRGHIARRADLTWGPLDEAKRANKDSFFFTNITPQHKKFNQSSAHGIWGMLEDAVYEEVEVNRFRLSVMGGPVFTADDPDYRGVKVPQQFWKVIYFCEEGVKGVQAKGYVLTQANLVNQLERLELPEFAVYEVPLKKIEEMTDLVLDPGSQLVLERRELKAGLEAAEERKIRRIESVSDIMGRL